MTKNVLKFRFNQLKSEKILVETYCDNTLPNTTCEDWFRRFTHNDFDLEDHERYGASSKFEEELEAFFN